MAGLKVPRLSLIKPPLSLDVAVPVNTTPLKLPDAAAKRSIISPDSLGHIPPEGSLRIFPDPGIFQGNLDRQSVTRPPEGFMERLLRSARLFARTVALSHLTVIMGVPSNGGGGPIGRPGSTVQYFPDPPTDKPAASDTPGQEPVLETAAPETVLERPSLGLLGDALRSAPKPTYIAIHDDTPQKFWTILDLLNRGDVPRAVAYRVLKKQPSDSVDSLMREFQGLLLDSQVRADLTRLGEVGLERFLGEKGKMVEDSNFRNSVRRMAQYRAGSDYFRYHREQYLESSKVPVFFYIAKDGGVYSNVTTQDEHWMYAARQRDIDRQMAIQPGLIETEITQQFPIQVLDSHKDGQRIGPEIEVTTNFRMAEEVIWPEDAPWLGTPPPPIWFDKQAAKTLLGTDGTEDLNIAEDYSVRDILGLKVAEAYVLAGFETKLDRGATDFEFNLDPKVFPTQYDRYTTRTTVRTERLNGTGAFIVTVTPVDNTDLTTGDHVSGVMSIYDPPVVRRLHELVAEPLGIEPGAVPDVADHRERIMIMAKSRDSDIFKAWLEPHYEEGYALLIGVNCEFYNESGDPVMQRRLPATNHEELRRAVIRDFAGRKVGRKIDRYSRVTVGADNSTLTFTFSDEAHPHKEMVISGDSGEGIIHSQYKVAAISIDALRRLGVKGTGGDRMVSSHAHAGLSERLPTSKGLRFSIDPVLGTLGEIVRHSPEFYGYFPSSPIRKGFIKDFSPGLARLLDPTLTSDLVSDPTSPRQILRVSDIIAKHRDPKYSNFNVDGALTYLLKRMGNEGVLQSGTVTDTWHGEARRFNISVDHNTQTVVVDRTITFLQHVKSVLARMRQQGELQEGQEVFVTWHDQVYRFRLKRDEKERLIPHKAERVPPMVANAGTGRPGIRHLMRSPNPFRTIENRIGDMVVDDATNVQKWESFAAWAWWHGTAQFLTRVGKEVASSALAVEGALKAVGIGPEDTSPAADAANTPPAPPPAASDSGAFNIPPHTD